MVYIIDEAEKPSGPDGSCVEKGTNASYELCYGMEVSTFRRSEKKLPTSISGSGVHDNRVGADTLYAFRPELCFPLYR